MRLERKESKGDRVQAKLRKAVEKRQRTFLWTPKHSFCFVPRVLPVIYGDGRALFTLSTINQRPAYWVIRGCSTWGSGFDNSQSDGPDFAELTDDILTDLEQAFGNGRCGYSGNSLFFPRRERVEDCQCEECTDRFTARWPMVDGCGGCSWSRMDWPKGFATTGNPLSRSGNLLRDDRRAPSTEKGR